MLIEAVLFFKVNNNRLIFAIEQDSKYFN